MPHHTKAWRPRTLQQRSHLKVGLDLPKTAMKLCRQGLATSSARQRRKHRASSTLGARCPGSSRDNQSNTLTQGPRGRPVGTVVYTRTSCRFLPVGRRRAGSRPPTLFAGFHIP